MEATIKKLIELRNDIIAVVKVQTAPTLTISPMMCKLSTGEIMIMNDIMVGESRISFGFQNMHKHEEIVEMCRREFESRKEQLAAEQIEVLEKRKSELEKELKLLNQ